MSSDQRYTQQEVDAILKRALERDGAKQSSGDALSHNDLIETAREVGIEPSQVEAAIAEVKRDGTQIALRDEWTARRRQRLARDARSWAFTGVLCLIINLMTGGLAGGAIWFPWVVVPWGAMILMQYLSARSGPSSQELARLDQQLQREERKRELEMKFQRGAEVLETVVEQGAKLLASHLDERARRREAGRNERLDRLPPRR